MKKISRWTVGLLIALLTIALLTQNDKQHAHDTDAEKHKVEKISEMQTPPRSDTLPSEISRAPAKDDQGNLQTMVSMLSEFTKADANISDLLSHLESAEQKPTVTRDVNSSSGEMHVIRTRKPLSGTRYFHAQYFTNDNGEAFVQHMSVEFQPSPTALAEAITAVQKSFNVGAPLVQTASYAKWMLGEGHIIWVKKMELEDLQDDPFNAYTESDRGTIRLAVEAEIH